MRSSPAGIGRATLRRYGEPDRKPVALLAEPLLAEPAYDNYEALKEFAIAAWHYTVLDAPLMRACLRRTLLRTR